MKLFSLRRSLLAIIAVLAGAGVLLFSGVTASAQDPRGKAINQQDLPPNAEVSFDGYLNPEEISHPLNKAEGAGALYTKHKTTPGLYDYSSVYLYSSRLVDRGSYVANYLYEYKDPAQAQSAAAQFVQMVVTEANSLSQVDRSIGTSQKKEMTGEVMTVVNPEDGVELIWYVATNDNILSLVLVDGVDSNTNKALFRSTLDMREN